MKNKTVKELIILVREGDYYSFKELLAKYRYILNQYASIIPSSDSCEEVESYFCELILSLKLDDFENDKAIKSYIEISIKRFAWKRANYYIKNNIFTEYDYNNVKEEGIDDNILFYDIINKLDERSKRLIILRYKNDMTYEKISKLYNVSPQAIKKK